MAGINRTSRRWNTVINIIVIVLLLLLIIISLTGLILNNVGEITSYQSIFSFIITSLALFVTTSIFLPKYTLQQNVEDEVAEAVDKYKLELKNISNQYKLSIKENKIELLRVEAHENRMTAYLLVRSGNYDWALGWTLKSLKTYIKLYLEKPYKYDEFIEKDLLQRILDIEPKIMTWKDDNKHEYLISIRKWKDFFECLYFYHEMVNYTIDIFDDQEKEYFINGKNAIQYTLEKGLEVLKKQLDVQKIEDKEKRELFLRIRNFDEVMFLKFEKFIEKPNSFKNINDIINQKLDGPSKTKHKL